MTLNRRHVRKTTLTVATALWLMPGGVYGQGSSWYSSVYQGYSNNRMLSNSRAAVRSSVRRGPLASPSASIPAAPRRPLGHAATTSRITPSTTFRPVAPTLMPQRIAASLGNSVAERRQMERTFLEMLAIYVEVARNNGAPPNDVARATAYMVNSSYHVYSGGRGLTDPQFATLRRRIERSLLDDSAFQRMSDAERQAIYEDFAIAGSFVMFAYQASKRSGNKAASDDAHRLARQNIEQALGVPPERIQLLEGDLNF